MSSINIKTATGYQVLASMGKKVLRPGGMQLTKVMLGYLDITQADEVLEWAFGYGMTMMETFKNQAKSYTGIEKDPELVQEFQKRFQQENVQIMMESQVDQELEGKKYSVIYGEAFLTLQALHKKKELIKKAKHLLKENGRYGMHELCLVPDNLDQEKKKQIIKDLSHYIKVNAQPLTQKKWIEFFEKEGFQVKNKKVEPVHLLNPKTIFQEEGFLGFTKIMSSLIFNFEARQRVLEMRKVIRTYQEHLAAITMVCEFK